MKSLLISLFLLLSFSSGAMNYYFSGSGSDCASCGKSPDSPWRSFANLQSVTINPGDTIFIMGEMSSAEKLYLWKWSNGGSASGNVPGSSASEHIVITAYPAGDTSSIRFTSTTENGFELYNVQGLKIENLNIIGPGASASSATGISFYADAAFGAGTSAKLENIIIDRVQVSGFKTGCIIGSWAGMVGFKNVRITNSDFFENRENGLFTYAEKKAHENIYVGHCKAYSQTGTLGSSNPTGSGIVISGTDGGLVEHCIAYNNGINNTNSAGPVGIWMYECNNVIIQYCESYSNKTSGGDGGGFDIDGGATNCIIQYCYSHDNDGPGYLYAQYIEATDFYNNHIRYNISQNDVRKSGYGAIHVWGSDRNVYGARDSYIYNNTVYFESNNTNNAAIKLSEKFSGIQVLNNIFYVKGSAKMVHSSKTETSDQLFLGNCYYNEGGRYEYILASQKYNSLASWRNSGQEILHERGTGVETDPLLEAPGIAGTLNNTRELQSLYQYKLSPYSSLIDQGVHPATGVSPAIGDFFGMHLPQNAGYDIGASEVISTITSTTPQKAEELILFPVPAVSDVNFNANSGDKIRVYTITGILVLEKTASAGLNKLPISDQEPGTYIFELEGPENTRRTVFVIQR